MKRIISRVVVCIAASCAFGAGVFAQAPQITEQPVSRTVSEPNQIVTFTVTATGAAPLAYQWWKNGVDLFGGNSSAYTITDVHPQDSGDYTVVVSNAEGSVESDVATLNYVQPPSIPYQIHEVTVNAVGDRPVTFVGAGGNQSYFVTDDGAFWGMGQGPLDSTYSSINTARTTPVRVASGVSSVWGAPPLFTKSDGTLWGVGYDSNGQQLYLYSGVKWLPAPAFEPVQIPLSVRSCAVGGGFSLFLKEDDTLWGVGSNGHGQLGDGTTNPHAELFQIATGVASVAAGIDFVHFVKNDGTLWAMGNNAFGQLGDGTTAVRSPPVQVASGVKFVTAGHSHALFIKTDNTLWAMGVNEHGQLGDGTVTNRSTPILVAAGVETAAAGADHSVFLKKDATLWAMGRNDSGQLGDGSSIQQAEPVQIATDVQAVACGASHTLFATTDGVLWGAGSNYWGQLGIGVHEARAVPTRVGSLVMSIQAYGNEPISYQWRRDGANIAGATSETLVIERPQSEDGGIYTVLVANAYGSVVSAPITVTVNSGPTLSAQPASQVVTTSGRGVTLSVAADSVTPISYQWLKNGVAIAGATESSYTIDTVTTGTAGSYSVIVSNAAGSSTSAAATLTVDSSPRLVNVSARSFAGSGGSTLIVGFVIDGTGSKTLLIRGIGPKLLDKGVPVVVADPSLAVYSGESLIGENDDWDPALAADFASVGAFALDANSKDAALEVTLEPGAYTIHLINPGQVAEALLEVYDLSGDAGTKLVNVSCRRNLAAGEIAILGTYLVGSDSTILVRGAGPGMAPYLLEHDRPFALPDPSLRFYQGDGTQIGENDDWDSALSADFEAAGAFALTPGSKDAADTISISPGAYTIHAVGTEAGGIVLIELYALD